MIKLFRLPNLFSFAICITLFTSCSVNKVDVDNSLKKYFDDNKVDGCFSLLNNVDGRIIVYNMALETQRFSPASTFKIVNSLIGLQTGIINNTQMLIKWDGISRSVPEWNKDLTMYEAFKVSAVSYFQFFWLLPGNKKPQTP